MPCEDHAREAAAFATAHGIRPAGAVDDNARLVYRNLHRITRLFPTTDSRQAARSHRGLLLGDDEGGHSEPPTYVWAKDVRRGPTAITLVVRYVESLAAGGKCDLTGWPYQAMLGGIGHALVGAVEEAIPFHAIARDRSRSR